MTTKTSGLSRRKMMQGGLGVVAAGAVGGAGVFRAIARENGLRTLTRAGMAFQTPVSLVIAGPDPRALAIAMDAAFAGLRAVENASSVYRRDSDLSRLNRLGYLERPDPHLVTLLNYARALSQDSAGAYDVTIQPLWDLWATHHAAGKRPDAAALRDATARVDWRGVEIEPDKIRLARPGMAVSLNSINQGYAADVVMDVLIRSGIEHALVDTSEFGARGTHPDGRAWRLGVVDPRDTDSIAFTFDPFRRFAATSGDYATYFSPDFRDHHIFDPKTGLSPTEWSSVTVSASSGLEADGLSTALFVLGPSAAAKLLASRPACTARLFTKSGLPFDLVV